VVNCFHGASSSFHTWPTAAFGGEGAYRSPRFFVRGKAIPSLGQSERPIANDLPWPSYARSRRRTAVERGGALSLSNRVTIGYRATVGNGSEHRTWSFVAEEISEDDAIWTALKEFRRDEVRTLIGWPRELESVSVFSITSAEERE
jgi:hypothetical protein